MPEVEETTILGSARASGSQQVAQGATCCEDAQARGLYGFAASQGSRYAG